MSVVDWLLIGAVAVFAFGGWRRGFVKGIFSLVGFLAGGIAAALVLPDFIAEHTDPGFTRAALVAGAVLLCAIVAQVLMLALGARIGSVITWQPAVIVDRLLGAALSVMAFAIVMWIVASAIAALPESPVSRALRQSQALVALDRLVPDQARDLFMNLRDAVADTAVPRVFAGLGEISGPDVPTPDPQATASDAIAEAARSVVRVSGSAPACDTGLTGSGFVVGRGLVLTNAHVVAGVEAPIVEGAGVDADGGMGLAAEVIAFDPRLDAALLRVRGLDAPPLPWAERAPRSGDDAIAAGYPNGGDYTAVPVRIRTVVQARGESIYGKAGVEREVVAFRGTVVPGNSGGPLLSPSGAVLGMVFGSGITDASTGYAITADELRAIAATREREPVSTGSCRVRDSIAD